MKRRPFERGRGFLLVSCILALGFWQLGQGAYIPAKAWVAQEMMQRAWRRAESGDSKAAPWPWADTWPVARLSARGGDVQLIVLEGGSGRTLLVKEDGTIIAGPDATPAMKNKSEAYSALVDSEAGARSRGSGYVTVDLSGPVRTLVAYADAGLKTSYPALGWTVLVTQDTREAFAPIRLVSRMIWLLSMLGLALVTLLTVYFSLHREAPITDIQQPAAEANPATQNR